MKKELCKKAFESYQPILSRYNKSLKLNLIENAPTPSWQVENGVLSIGISSQTVAEIEAIIAYAVQQAVLPVLTIETERLIVRRLQQIDLKDFFEIASCEEIAVWDGCKPYKTIEDCAKDFEGFLTDKHRYVAVLKSENKAIGIINLREIDSRAVTAYDIGYDVNKNYWRKGYAFEYLSAFLDCCLNELNIDLITAGCFEGNEPSMNLLKKLGFAYEGRLKKALYHGALGPMDVNSFYIEKGTSIKRERGD